MTRRRARFLADHFEAKSPAQAARETRALARLQAARSAAARARARKGGKTVPVRNLPRFLSRGQSTAGAGGDGPHGGAPPLSGDSPEARGAGGQVKAAGKRVVGGMKKVVASTVGGARALELKVEETAQLAARSVKDGVGYGVGTVGRPTRLLLLLWLRARFALCPHTHTRARKQHSRALTQPSAHDPRPFTHGPALCERESTSLPWA